MPPIYTATFPIRFYECDPIGHLNNATYLRIMQEAAFDASTSLGFDRQRYSKEGFLWLVRETEIEYFSPVYYGETVEVRTWVFDMHRVRSYRMYEFRKAGQEKIVARAWSDWVFLNKETKMPAKIPDAIRAAYLGDETHPALPRHRFPEMPPPAPEIFKVQKTVEWRDLDPWGHVHNAVYLAYLEDCGMQIAEAYHYPWEQMEHENFAIVSRKHHIEYKQPLLLGEKFEIESWVSSLRRSTAVRHFVIRRLRDRAVAAQSHSFYVWINLQTQKPIRVPEKFMNAFRQNVTDAMFKPADVGPVFPGEI
jgi:acyl-CoA thioester hydrolase